MAPRTRKASILDPFYDYLCQRWNDESPTAPQLFEEVREKGYRGSETLVKDFVTRLRRGLPGMRTPPQFKENKRSDTRSFPEGIALAPRQTRPGSHI